jgi:hypothetical protein
MRITNWKKFNESVNEEFTEEMAQEIIYCFSDGSTLSGELESLVIKFDESLNKENINSESHFMMYEPGYDEMKGMVKKLYGFVQTLNLSFKDDMINLYHEIRKVKEKFPEVFEIEDLFLTFIESNNFQFYLDYMKAYSDDGPMIYQIRLRSQWDTIYSMSDFQKLSDTVSGIVKIFSHPSSRMYVQQCKYYNYERQNKTSVDFEIIIK